MTPTFNNRFLKLGEGIFLNSFHKVSITLKLKSYKITWKKYYIAISFMDRNANCLNKILIVIIQQYMEIICVYLSSCVYSRHGKWFQPLQVSKCKPSQWHTERKCHLITAMWCHRCRKSIWSSHLMFMIKTLSVLQIEGNILILIKNIYKTFLVGIIFNGKNNSNS
jgi:hypothetical protein